MSGSPDPTRKRHDTPDRSEEQETRCTKTPEMTGSPDPMRKRHDTPDRSGEQETRCTKTPEMSGSPNPIRKRHDTSSSSDAEKDSESASHDVTSVGSPADVPDVKVETTEPVKKEEQSPISGAYPTKDEPYER